MFSDVNSINEFQAPLFTHPTQSWESSTEFFDFNELNNERLYQSTPLMGERVSVEDNPLLLALSRLMQKPKEFDEDWQAQQKYGYVLAKMNLGIRTNCSSEVKDLLEECRESIPPYLETKNFASEEEKTRFFLSKTVDCIFNPENFSHLHQRVRYKEMVRNFRNALQSDFYLTHPESTISQLLNQIAFSIYSDVEVQSYTQSVVEHHSSESGSSSSSNSSEDDEFFPETLETIDHFMETVSHEHLSTFHASVPHKEKIGQKIRGHFSVFGFDPILQGNPPNVKFKLLNKDNALITAVRTPTPTDEDGNVSPEFKAFLRYLKAHGKTYVMINLQNRTNPSFFQKLLTADGESVRSHNLEQLALEDEFKDVITVFTFDKNSDFFYQHNSPLIQDGREFCNQFIRHIFDSPAFHVPEDWWTDEKFAKISQKINFIYTKFFDEKGTLTIPERKDFIEIGYLFLTDFIVEETGAEYYNTSCKDCIDRGTGTIWLLMALMTLLETQLQDRLHPGAAPLSDRIESLPAKLEEDAFWARKRRIIDERMERAQSAIYRMGEKIKTVPGLAEELVEVFHFKSIYLPEDESIKFNPEKANLVS